MTKVILIILAVVLVLGCVGYIIVKKMFPDQITLQYDNETKSDFKRKLDYGPYDIEGFKVKYNSLKAKILNQPIEQIQAGLEEGAYTCEELAMFYLYRIHLYEDYNAVIQLNPNIIKEAKALDEKIKKGQAGDLFGVMVLIKDNIADMSMNTATGAYVLKDLTTTRDAQVVSHMKAEDALVLGKANLSEWSNFMSMPSSNGFSVLGGQTKNAYGKHDVGGSSSGSSVAAALGLSTVTLGTETSGSLIYPAGQNSVVAIKPSLGLISRDLIVPIAEAQDTAGVIGRRVEDVYRVFKHLIKYDDKDHGTSLVESYVGKDTLEKPHNLKIGVLKSESKEMTRIIGEFKALGVEVVTIELGSDKGTDILSVLNWGMVHDLEAFLNNPAVVTDIKSLKDVIDFNKANEAYRPFGQTLLEGAYGQKKSEEDIKRIISKNQSICRAVLDQAMVDYDIDMILSLSNDLSHLYAPAGYPALTVPAGYRASGEPFGITLVGNLLEDVKVFEMGLLYEQASQHRKEP